ncbi:MAG: acetolactate synthase large subunit [Reyranellaceae bacterium]
MNGAESLVRTLVAGGVDVCFTNPGTSEMHFVAALDRVEGMRCVLGLFEGVVTGAADGYARMLDRPAATLLHLGPGLGNGLANLHNAKKAAVPIVNIVGEHATYHIGYDSPLTADIEGIARPVSHWVKTSRSAQVVAADGAAAIAAARTAPGQIATLILPADTAWNEGSGIARTAAPAPRRRIDDAAIENAARVLKANGKDAMLMLTGPALRERPLELAGRIAAATGCRLSAQWSNVRMQRGAGRVFIPRLPYAVDPTLAMLKDVRYLVLCGARQPVAFFAYPDKPSLLTPDGCAIHKFAALEDDLPDALERLAEALNARQAAPVLQQAQRPDAPTGAFTLDKLGAALGATLPENAVVIDESVTSGRGFAPFTAGAPPHDWITNMGGSIGFSTPVAVGVAIAAPERKVVCLTGDGSAFYTLQSLWTMAREKLDVLVVIFANRSYAILRGELAGVGAGNPGPKAIDMLTLDRPDPDWVALAKGMGVEGVRVADSDQLVKALQAGFAAKGPRLIEVWM